MPMRRICLICNGGPPRMSTRFSGDVKPAHLPVERPSKFVLAINRQTARDLDLAIPPSVLVWGQPVY